MRKFLKGWRTRLYALLNVLTGAIMAVEPSTLQAVTSDDAAVRRFGYVLIAQGAITWALRQVTTTPPGEKY